MSAICGIVAFDGTAAPETELERMVSAAPHRGPVTRRWDGAGAALLSQARAGTSPLAATVVGVADIVVVADARIDNHRELVASLRSAGHLVNGDQYTQTAAGDEGTDPMGDALLIAAAHRCWGPAFVERLIGDFAIAVWEPRRRRLTMARDPMGMRALYYRLEPGRRVILATEAKQILALPSVSRRINESAVAAFLLTRTQLYDDDSYWQTVSLLAAGHVLVCDASGHTRRRYWDIDPQHRLFHRDQEAAASHLRQILTEAVSARLRHSAAPAIMLSGGMDSGSAAAIAGRLIQDGHVATTSLSAYCWSFDELTACDERHISRHIVEHYDIRQVDVPADDAGPLASYPEHDVDQDDPRVGAFQTLIERTLMRAHQHGVDLMLGGDRGDLTVGSAEFGYLRLALGRQWTNMRHEIREQQGALGDSVGTIFRRHLLGPLGYRLRRRSLAEWPAWARRRVAALHPARSAPRSVPSWVRQGFARRANPDQLEVPSGMGPARAQRYRFVFMPLHMGGMIWSERTYARYGIGFADPFSDRRLVEFVMALPQALINRPNDLSKPLLRRGMRKVMPEPARVAATKILPTPLYLHGLRREHDVVRSLLTDSRAQAHGWVDSRALLAHYRAWQAGEPLQPGWWYALSVERWLRVNGL